MTSTGGNTMGILILLGNKESFDDFCVELRMRIFILLGSHDNFGDLMLGSNEDSVGRRVTAEE